MKCRHCQAEITLPLVDLGSAPPSNAYLTSKTLKSPEKWFPLRVLVCEQCWLVQTEDFTQAHELFDSDYAYFSSYSSVWLSHAEKYVADMIKRFSLNDKSHVVEVAANDGYLLQYVIAAGIPCTGIEPTDSTAAAAEKKGIEIVKDFFGMRLAKKLVNAGKQADLISANNVLAHVPDINDFVAGFACLLKPQGVATFEFPHLLRLVEEKQFDTIYHEHFSYLSLNAVNRIFKLNGLKIFDVEEIPTHGGSLRVYAQRKDTGKRHCSKSVQKLLKHEVQVGMTNVSYYADFQGKIDAIKNSFLSFLLDAKQHKKSVAAYGAAAKGNTLMNYAGVRPDLVQFVVDRNPTKQDKFMPGSRIPIVDENRLKSAKTDYIIVLPWNIRDEIVQQLDYVKAWGGKLVTAVPEMTIYS